ncbi:MULTISPECIES: hypothetical protein [unclassified Bradyrhizobium]|uniref:hypothetical protein n=1 Tax=unclassified Bradyrhizobium TaxID=2631580 RepID=UPI0028EAD71C|nr:MULTISPECIES: hypothetical protein [unclassified Bradyrhizobium]
MAIMALNPGTDDIAALALAGAASHGAISDDERFHSADTARASISVTFHVAGDQAVIAKTPRLRTGTTGSNGVKLKS